MGVFGHTERSTTHIAAGTLGSLRFCRGRGGIGTPRGGLEGTPNVRSVLPPSIAEGGVRGAEVPPSLQDTENAK